MSYSDIARGLEVVFETCAVYEVGLVPREVDEFADALERAGVSVAAFRQLAELIHRARHKSSGAPTLWRRDTTRLSAWEFEGD